MENKLITHDLSLFDRPFSTAKPSYLVILNRKLKKDLFKKVYQSASNLICTDGGANHLYDCFQSDEER